MPLWHIQLLGGLRATRGNAVIAQFPSRPIAMLLALLALQPQRRHSREELIELLWPGVELDVGRNRLRQVLSTLRRLLEPPDVPPDSVLIADRQTIGLNADAVASDVREFEQLLRQGATAQALDCYRGDLLPGFLDEWVEDERIRLSALYERAVARSQQRSNESGGAGRAQSNESRAGRGEEAPEHTAERASASRSLPSYVSAFFDRETDMRHVLDALAEYRLVTLAGLGGFGKTRLAVESARAAEGFDPVAFVPLSECSTADLIADSIRGALRMEAAQEDALAQLCAFLSERDVLLALDNFEQLVDDGARVVLDLLERLPRLRCLVTSRRVLDVPGEHVLVVDPLPVPQPSMRAAEAVATPSLALFIDRARGARADFALTDDNREALIEITRALEGLPLAIEIAASRIRSYSPSEMRDALAARFDVLTRQGQRGARYGRHASLQATIEWSWNLLSESEQAFFAALSVFRGGFAAGAVEAVCKTKDSRGALEALVAASLLRAETGEAGTTRFSMLDTLREFAQERLGAGARELRARHRAYFLQIAREAAGADRSIAAREMPNLKQALVTAVEDGEPACALDLGVALRTHWEAHGTLPDELRLLGQAADACTHAEPGLHAGLNLLAQLALSAGDIERARGYAERALKEAGDDAGRRAAALVSLARVSWERDQRDKTVTRSLDEALALAAKAGAVEVEADALLRQGQGRPQARRGRCGFQDRECVAREGRSALPEDRAAALGASGAALARRRARRAQALQAGASGARGMRAILRRARFGGRPDQPGQHDRLHRIRAEALDRSARGGPPLRAARLGAPRASAPRRGPVESAAAADDARRTRHRGAIDFVRGAFLGASIGPLSAHDVRVIEEQRKATARKLGAQPAKMLWAEGAALSLAEAVELALSGRDRQT